jgi:hypothetical protein
VATKIHPLMFAVLFAATFMSYPASAHDPVFGLGPHTLYKGGVELHAGGHSEKSGNASEKEAELQFKYGLTSDWVIGVGVPYEFGDDEGSHRGSTSLSTKYRFWRQDRFAVQESMALLGRVIFDNGEEQAGVERNGNDYLLGITYGYEGRKWYRWASVRHRFNAETSTGMQRPDVWLVDFVGGIRFSPTEYHEPDWVWMLELNGELIENVTQGLGSVKKQLGGNQWFLSPGLMWTHRNFAFKAGVQLPLIDDLSADQEQDDYRAKIELEWHL